MDIHPGTQRMAILFHRERIFSIRFLKASWASVHGDHAELFLRPFLNIAVAELNGHLSRALDDHRSAYFFPVDVHSKVSGKPLEIFLPSGCVVESPAERFTGFGIVCDGRLIWLVHIHDDISSMSKKVNVGIIPAASRRAQWSEIPKGYSGWHFQTAVDSDIVRQFGFGRSTGLR